MKIALINENSQAAKNGIIEAALKKVVEPMGHEVVNYGMYAADDAAQLTYVQCGILAAILLNSGAADYVITGCGTGEGAMLALNSFPGVICGHVEDPVDAYTFAHVNDGNAVAMPFAKGFGWGGELNLEYCFEKLFGFGHGQGYPKERVEPEQRNKKILDGVRAATFKPLIECLKSIDQDLLKGARVELYYCGSADAERVQAAFGPLVDLLPEGKRAELARPAKQKAPKKPRRVEEVLDVTQGKLAMGFRTNCDAWDERYPALMLVNAIYGGTTTSKLFMNVREKLSLCYYASSGLMKYKDVMLVSSGVEFDKVGQAEAEILSQLYKCQSGDFTGDELEWARRSVVSTLRTTLDTQGRLEDYWLGQSAAGLTDGPDQVAQKVEAVTRAQAVEAAQDLTLDTVYFLKGRE